MDKLLQIGNVEDVYSKGFGIFIKILSREIVRDNSLKWNESIILTNESITGKVELKK